MRKDAQAVLLLLIGGTLLKISLAGTYVRYVKPGQLPLLLIAGVMLIVIAVATLWQVIRAPRDPAPTSDRPDLDVASGFEDLAVQPSPESTEPEPVPPAPPVQVAPKLSDLREPPALGEPGPRGGRRREAFQPFASDPSAPQEVTYREFTPGELVAVPAGHAARDGGAHAGHAARAAVAAPEPDLAGQDHADRGPVHGHAHGEPRVAWLLLLPALALLLFAPPALGSYQATRNGTALSAQADSDFPPLPEGDPVRISLLDYAGRAVFDQGKSLRDRRVTLSGFIIAGPNGQPYLARMIVTCCAADARPVKVGLAGDLPTALQPDEWIEVVGTFVDRADKDPVNAELVPYIQVSTLHDIAAPKEQYES